MKPKFIKRSNPYNIEAEQAVLGAILLDNAALQRATAILKPHHFYREAHRHIYRVMLALQTAGDPIDLLTLADRLRKEGRLEEAGGEAYLAALVDAVPTAANLVYHARMVKAEAKRRDLVAITEEIRARLVVEDPDEIACRAMACLEETLEERTEGAALPLIEMAELLSSDGEGVEWVVQGLIVRGSVTALMGMPSGYKTWWAFSLARAVAQGTPFLSRPTLRAPVYYIDRENPEALWRQRVEILAPPKGISLWPLWASPEPPPLGHPAYRQIATKGGLLMFDSFRRFHGANENAPEEMAPIMAHLRALAQKGATVLVIHHAGKAEGNAYRGTTEILAGVDAAFSLERRGGENREKGEPVPLTLRCLKHRFIEEPILSLEFRAGDGFVDVTQGQVEAKREEEEHRLEEAREVIGELQGNEDPPTQTQVLKAIHDHMGLGKDAALSLLAKGEGRFWQSEGGGRGKPKLYWTLPAPELERLSGFRDPYIGGRQPEKFEEADLWTGSPP